MVSLHLCWSDVMLCGTYCVSAPAHGFVGCLSRLSLSMIADRGQLRIMRLDIHQHRPAGIT